MLTLLASQVAVAIENARLYAEIVRKDARIQKELSIAQVIQHGLFPETFPTGPAWDASAHFLPARELGGDLYDFYEIGERRPRAWPSGDVAGKGVPAALYGAFASGTVRSRAFERHPPADVLRRVNRTLVHARRRRPLLHPGLCPVRLRARHGDARQLGPALSAALPGRDRPLRADRAARPAPRRLRGRHLRRARGRPRRRATSSCSTPTGCPRPVPAARTTAWRACGGRWRSTRARRRPRSASGSWPTSAGSWATPRGGDDLTLLIVKVRVSERHDSDGYGYRMTLAAWPSLAAPCPCGSRAGGRCG